MEADRGQARPFLSVRPGTFAPLILTCEHATHRLPSRRGLSGSEREILETHWGWDIGAWELTRELARRLRCPALGARWSRLLIDPNRRVDDPTLIRRSAGGVELSFNLAVDADEIERRVLAYHTPYHAELDRWILRRVVRGVRPLLFAVHTFTPEYQGRRRTFEIGLLYEHHGKLARTLGRSLRSDGFTVRYNQPYSGLAGMMYSIDRHGTHHGLPCLELEVNQAMFRRRSNLSRLGRALAAGVEKLLDAV